MNVPYVTQAILLNAVKETNKYPRLRFPEPQVIDALNPDYKYPVVWHMFHDAGRVGRPSVRALVQLGNPLGERPWIFTDDVLVEFPPEVFRNLPTIDISTPEVTGETE